MQFSDKIRLLVREAEEHLGGAFATIDDIALANTERVMDALIPKEEQSDFCHRIVEFGREICTARAPKCGECPLKSVCKHDKNEKTS